MNTLFRSFKRVKQIYSRPSSQDVFRQILANKNLTRFIVDLFTKLQSTKFFSIILSVYSFKAMLSVPFPKSNGSIIAIGTTANEFAYIKYIRKCLQNYRVEIVSPSIKCLFDPRNIRLIVNIIMHPGKTMKYIKIISYFNSDDFITGCLKASCLGYYVKILYIMKITDPRAVLVTSNYAPDSCALTSAANSLNIPVIFYPHGVITDFNKPVDFGYDLAIFSGQYAFDVFRANNADFSPEVVYCGIKGKTKPLNIDVLKNGYPRKVGIFLTAKTNMDVLGELVEQLRHKWKTEKILIRPHPVDLIRPDFTDLAATENLVISPQGTSLIDDVEQVDFAFIGNSSVHLEVLKLGVPVVYLGNLDTYDFDTNRFVKFRIVPSAQSVNNINPDKIIKFYVGDWKERFRYFDAGYGKRAEELDDNIKDRIEDLLN